MDFNSKLEALTNRDIELNEQYRKELLETKDVECYDLKMEFKTKWFKLELYNLINNKDDRKM